MQRINEDVLEFVASLDSQQLRTANTKSTMDIRLVNRYIFYAYKFAENQLLKDDKSFHRRFFSVLESTDCLTLKKKIVQDKIW